VGVRVEGRVPAADALPYRRVWLRVRLDRTCIMLYDAATVAVPAAYYPGIVRAGITIIIARHVTSQSTHVYIYMFSPIIIKL
jgi:hypothetical protein